MEEIEAKISAIDSKQYYQLNPYERLQDDQISQTGSEDVEMINHRYDSPVTSVTKTKSIAEELLEEKEKNVRPERPEPPPDLLVSSNLRYETYHVQLTVHP